MSQEIRNLSLRNSPRTSGHVASNKRRLNQFVLHSTARQEAAPPRSRLCLSMRVGWESRTSRPACVTLKCPSLITK